MMSTYFPTRKAFCYSLLYLSAAAAFLYWSYLLQQIFGVWPPLLISLAVLCGCVSLLTLLTSSVRVPYVIASVSTIILIVSGWSAVGNSQSIIALSALAACLAVLFFIPMYLEQRKSPASETEQPLLQRLFAMPTFRSEKRETDKKRANG
jgi:hypothetical protein